MAETWHPLATTKQEDCIFGKFPYNITNIIREDNRITFDVELVNPTTFSTIQQQILFIPNISENENKHVKIVQTESDYIIRILQGYVDDANRYVTIYIESLMTT